jgi:chorismate mutase|tara:strand:- start:11361 stop:12401 length:1041 start_codon:yes stop_codon:yes gene_type:complete
LRNSLKQLIAGPCSAETREQVLETAKEIADIKNLTYFRAGIWKPRTAPGSFEGIGEEGLKWMNEAKQQFGVKLITEVATPEHVDTCLAHNLDAIWIGARTTVNPFYVQQIADSLKGIDIPVFIKNPISPDVGLWMGAIERFKLAGIKNISVIHRGFYSYTKGIFRNPPMWEIPIKLKTEFPDLQIICDPSHITGDSELIEEVSKFAVQLGMDGLMIETHPNPPKAWSDAKQQVTPDHLKKIVNAINANEVNRDIKHEELEILRKTVTSSDDDMLKEIAHRMKIVEKIATFKKENSAMVFQLERWKIVLEESNKRGAELGLSEQFVADLMNLIHRESLNIHNTIYNS